MKNNSGFFELLCLNDSEKLHQFLISNGKGPKPTCPITFANINDNENQE